MLAHAYISSTVDVSEIVKSFKDVPFDSFVYKACARAFKDAVNSDKLTISRVHSVEKRDVFANATDLRVGQFGKGAASAVMGQQISIHRIAQSIEALPICEEPNMLSVHFSEPR